MNVSVGASARTTPTVGGTELDFRSALVVLGKCFKQGASRHVAPVVGEFKRDPCIVVTGGIAV